jgi:hypothetical protein
MSELRAGEQTVMAQRPFITPQERAREERKKLWHILTGAAAGVLLVALLGLGGWLFLEWRETTAPPPPTQTASARANASSPAPSASKDAAGSASKKVVPGEALTKPSQEQATKVISAPATPTQPQPRVTPAVGAGGQAVKPTTVPAAATPVATKPKPGRVIALQCTHQLEEATLLILDGNTPVFQTRLIGKKKRGFIGIRGGYSGSLTESVTIPASARQLTVRVYSADGSVNVLNKISAVPPSPAANTLRVSLTRQRLALEWTAATSTPQ